MMEVNAHLEAAKHHKAPEKAEAEFQRAKAACERDAPAAGAHKDALLSHGRICGALAAARKGDNNGAITVIKGELTKAGGKGKSKILHAAKDLLSQMRTMQEVLQAARAAADCAREDGEKETSISARGEALEREEAATGVADSGNIEKQIEIKKKVAVNKLAQAAQEQSAEMYAEQAECYEGLVKLFEQAGKSDEARKCKGVASALKDASKEGLSQDDRAKLLSSSGELTQYAEDLYSQAIDAWNKAIPVQTLFERFRIKRWSVYLFNCASAIFGAMGKQFAAYSHKAAAYAKEGQAIVCQDSAGANALHTQAYEEFVAAGEAFFAVSKKEDSYYSLADAASSRAKSLDDSDPEKAKAWLEAAHNYDEARMIATSGIVNYYGYNGYRCRAWGTERLEDKYKSFTEAANYVVKYTAANKDSDGSSHFMAGSILAEAAGVADEFASSKKDQKETMKKLLSEALSYYNDAEKYYLEAAKIRSFKESPPANTCARLAQAVKNKLSALN